jgi:hypothetical protein
MTDQQLADAFMEEWKLIEEFRVARLTELLQVCKMIHTIREKLTENMIEVLVEDNWKEAEVTRALAEGVTCLIRAINGLEKPATLG